MAWKTTSDPKRTFVTLRLTDSEAADLDASASSAGMSRSGYVRDCLRRVVASDRRKAAALRGQEPEES